MGNSWRGPLEKIDNYRWRIPKSYMQGMRVPGVIYADENLLEDIKHDRAPEQVANAAHLPGIVKYSLAMPDIHWGYGLAIGGVVATDIEAGGVITPGGVGYDINCGVRLVHTNLFYEEVKGKIEDLVNALYHTIPAGLGSKGQIRINEAAEKKVMIKGAAWAVERGYGTKADLECTEENGQMKNADPERVSKRAYERGKPQSGTLGSGNHFLEVQVVDAIFDEKITSRFNLSKGQITVMIHTGSRGFGHQVCTDYIKVMLNCLRKYAIEVPDRQLACTPVESNEGKAYLAAMSCAANYAWANRQILMHLTRGVFEKFFRMSWEKLGMNLIYDVAHNIAKIERQVVDDKERLLCIHRKGATRAYPPGHKDLPPNYKEIGQPVIIPGDMGTNSYLLVGTEGAKETFYSSCHGAGRVLSRKEAKKRIQYSDLKDQLEAKGIVARAHSMGTLVEEAPMAYKNIDKVVDIVDGAGISKKVCRMSPLGVIKG